jgi:hypothetical protein
MRKFLIPAAAALCAASGPAAAYAPAQSNAQAEQTAQPRARNADTDERVICVTDQASETRIPRRICRTAKQWREANDTDDQR